MFTVAAHNTPLRRHIVFLDLFSGRSRVCEAWRRRGLAGLAFDIAEGEAFDLLRPATQNLILGWIKCGAIGGVWMSPPCASFAPRPVPDARNPRAPWRILASAPTLSKAENSALRFCLRVFKGCHKANVPCGLEAPQHSAIWATAEVRQVTALPEVRRGLLNSKRPHRRGLGCHLSPIADGPVATGRPSAPLPRISQDEAVSDPGPPYPRPLAFKSAEAVRISSDRLQIARLAELGSG